MTAAVALVTGATGSLGKAVVLELAAQGYQLILLGRRIGQLERVYDQAVEAGAASVGIYPLNLEGAQPTDYLKLAQTIEQEYGRLNRLIHAAAHFRGLEPLHLMAPADLLRALQVNLTGPLWLTQALVATLAATPGARVIFAGEDLAELRSSYFGAYAIARQALDAAIALLQIELRDRVLIEQISPGPFHSALRARCQMVPATDMDAPAEAARRLLAIDPGTRS